MAKYPGSQTLARLIVVIVSILVLLSPFANPTGNVALAQGPNAPTLSLAVPGGVFINSPFSFTATFSTTHTGYGPIIDLIQAVPSAMAFFRPIMSENTPVGSSASAEVAILAERTLAASAYEPDTLAKYRIGMERQNCKLLKKLNHVSSRMLV